MIERFFQAVKPIWNSFCVISLKAFTKKRLTVKSLIAFYGGS